MLLVKTWRLERGLNKIMELKFSLRLKSIFKIISTSKTQIGHIFKSSHKILKNEVFTFKVINLHKDISLHHWAFFQTSRNSICNFQLKECLGFQKWPVVVVTERCLSPESIMSKTGLGGWEKVAGVRPVNTREVELGSMTAVIGRVMGRACERCIMVMSFHSSADSDKTAV